MPEYSDCLADYLDAGRRQSLGELFSDYQVAMVSCVYFRNRAPWRLGKRRCPDSFFLFPALGRLRVSLESGSVEIPPGQFLMLPDGAPHALELIEGFEHLHQVSLHCHVHDRWGRPLLKRCGSAVGRLPARVHSLEALKELACLMAHDPEAGQRRGESLVKELLAFQLQQGMPFLPAQTSGDPRVGAVLLRMEEAFGSPELSVEGLARDVAITAVQLRKLFRRETGTSPKQFLGRLRLRKAARRLRQSRAGVKEVAAECGFASDHYFHRVFREEYGCTPSEYRTRSGFEV